MCGLVGFNGKAAANNAALKLMVMNNASRGKHSVGIFHSKPHVIYKHSGYKSGISYGNPLELFLELYWTSFNEKNEVIIIHNRHATSGSINEENAHPFEYEIDNVKHVFAHNGTITNIEKLCDKYDIKFSDFKVDSKALGYIIAKHGFDVLKEYEGYAAFLYYRSDMPDSLYAWKGASKEYTDEIVEERPLVYFSNKNQTYICSLFAGIQLAFDVPKTNIHSIEDNSLLLFTQGKLISNTVYDRSHQPKKAYLTTHGSYSGTSVRSSYKDSSYANDNRSSFNDNKVGKTYSKHHREPSSGKSEFYFQKGLYYYNGHPANGYFVEKNNNVVRSFISDIPTHFLSNGLRFVNEEAYKKSLLIPDSMRFTIFSKQYLIECLPLLHPKMVFFGWVSDKIIGVEDVFVVIKHNALFVSTNCKQLIDVSPEYSSYKYHIDMKNQTYYLTQVEIKNNLLLPFIETSAQVKNIYHD